MQSNTELRSWLIKLPWFESRLGINLFWDNGVVYDRSLKNWQRASTVGFGGFMSIAFDCAGPVSQSLLADTVMLPEPVLPAVTTSVGLEVVKFDAEKPVGKVHI
jgi:hypothetical protein